VTVILVAILAYTIVRHGLFDIRLAVVRGAAYVLSLLTLGGIYYLVAFAISELFFTNQSSSVINQNPLSILLALALAFIFQPVKTFFDKLTNRVFYRSNYSMDEFIIRVSRRLTMSNDLRELLQRAAQDIAETLKIEQVLFAARYRDGHMMSAGTRGHVRLTNDDLVAVDVFFQRAEDVILVVDTMSDSKEAPLRRLLSRHNIAAVVPLWQAASLIGYVFLGDKRTGHYVSRDINALRTIRDELVIAIQNALSVQDVKDINETLEQRIDEATKELRKSNSQLQRLDEAKDEFVSMASHQLRTPLTSVKGYLSMVLEGDVGKITDTQKKLLGEAFTSSERMVHLINDFLNVSRLQTGKFMLESRPLNLAKIVGQEVDSLQTTAVAHSMTLQYRAPSHFPILFFDESKIRQVVMNFIDNAIYYSKEHSTITITLEIEDAEAVLKVLDTGIGVPQAEQAHIFTKFFRAVNARRQRPDGTGVGLFLAKKVIVAHGGSMVFESTEGEGSTFGFRLPIKKLSTVPADDADELGK
jgi:signal transduction histidine kinase